MSTICNRTVAHLIFLISLSYVQPEGTKQYALCYQDSNDDGSAACSNNGIVYPDNGGSTFSITGSPGTLTYPNGVLETGFPTPIFPNLMTSTVYSTQEITVTSCAPTVTNCPEESIIVTTSVIAVSTTICPVTETETSTTSTTTECPTSTPTPVVVQPSAPIVVQPTSPEVSSTTVYTTYTYTSSNVYTMTTSCTTASESPITTTSFSTYTVVVQPSYSTSSSSPIAPYPAGNHSTPVATTGAPAPSPYTFTGSASAIKLSSALAAAGILVAVLL